MFGTGRVNKVFSPGIFIDVLKKMVTNMKLAFTYVPFRHNSKVLFKSG